MSSLYVLFLTRTRMMKYISFCILCVLAISSLPSRGEKQERDDEHGVIYPSKCEVCKYVAVELEARLQETGKTSDVLELGYSFDSPQNKKIKYKKSELRFIETMEEICERMLQYNVHKERKDSTRLAKGMSQTFQTLHGLVDKGVKVELGIPVDMWDKPPVEITSLKSKCEYLVETYEDDIKKWYFGHQTVPLKTYLCSQKVLRKGDDGCLIEELTNKDGKASETTKTTKNASNENGKKVSKSKSEKKAKNDEL